MSIFGVLDAVTPWVQARVYNTTAKGAGRVVVEGRSRPGRQARPVGEALRAPVVKLSPATMEMERRLRRCWSPWGWTQQ
jgi:hypothetical protein